MLVWSGAAANTVPSIWGVPDRCPQERTHRIQDQQGTIRFTPDRLLPAALLRKLVKTRIAERARP
jgi:hypothetical protein